MPAFCSRRVALLTIATLVFSTTANAQWRCPEPALTGPQPFAVAPPAVVAQAQPVFQTRYQTVPVTEMRPVETTVQRPETYTEYVEQPVTEYRPVIERQTRQIPTVQYRNVTQYRTVNRDVGRWVTHYQPIQRVTPCQVDSRPGLLGWMNRTGMSIGNSFRPQYRTSRQYYPRVVSQQIPFTRQVAVPTTRTVAYNVTRMVPQQTTRRVAVNKVRYVTEKRTIMQPTTAFRTVPIGTSLAYAAPMPVAPSTLAYGLGGSSVAYGPHGGMIASGPMYGGLAYDDLEVVDQTDPNARIASGDFVSPEPDDLAGADRPFDDDDDSDRPDSGYRRRPTTARSRDRDELLDRARRATEEYDEPPVRRSSSTTIRDQPPMVDDLFGTSENGPGASGSELDHTDSFNQPKFDDDQPHPTTEPFHSEGEDTQFFPGFEDLDNNSTSRGRSSSHSTARLSKPKSPTLQPVGWRARLAGPAQRQQIVRGPSLTTRELSVAAKIE